MQTVLQAFAPWLLPKTHGAEGQNRKGHIGSSVSPVGMRLAPTKPLAPRQRVLCVQYPFPTFLHFPMCFL